MPNNKWSPFNKKTFSVYNEKDASIIANTFKPIVEKKRKKFSHYDPTVKIFSQKGDVVRILSDEKENHDLRKKEEDNYKKTQENLETKKREIEKEKIKKIEKEAYEKAYADGLKEGFAKGEKAGSKTGKTEGMKDGREEGYLAGSLEGDLRGYEEGQKKAEKIIEHLKQVTDNLENQLQDMVSINEKKILQMIFKIVEKVIYAKLETDPEIIKKAILESFKFVPESDKAIISVSKEDYEYIEIVKNDFFENLKNLKNIEFVSNPSLNRGECKIETKAGEIETSAEERLEAIRRTILQEGIS